MQQHPSAGRGLTPRIAVAGALLALLTASTFAFLLAAVRDEARSSRSVRRIRAEMAVGEELARRFVELDRDVRGYALTGDPEFVETWDASRSSFLTAIETLGRSIDDTEVAARVVALRTASEAYLDQVLTPIVEHIAQGRSVADIEQLLRPPAAGSATVLHLFDVLRTAESERLDARMQRSDEATERAVLAALAGGVGSIVLVGACSAYLVHRVLRPLRRVSTMADRLAGGDLSVRLDSDGPGEIGQLERSFNTMGAALESGRDQLVGLADEQAALHRVAALVATGGAPADIFDAVVAEVEALARSDSTVLLRFDPPDAATVVAASQRIEGGRPVGTTWSHSGDDLIAAFAHDVRPPHAGSISSSSGPTAELLRGLGVHSLVGACIRVDGQVWGAISAVWVHEVPDPAATSRQVSEFTELLGAAIANVASRDELSASRARIVVAADTARRRIERDIHDGAQQRLIALGLELRLAQMSLPDDDPTRRELERLGDSLSDAVDSLQEVARGVHPAILSHGGLTPAVEGLARRSPVPTTISSSGDRRLDEQVEVAAYYFVSEALTNVAKHSGATEVTVQIAVGDDRLDVVVSDDGVGGASPANGSGLTGLRDRIEAVGGTLDIDSRHGVGTTLSACVPIGQASLPAGVGSIRGTMRRRDDASVTSHQADPPGA